ncbi:uncharacterized protein LOC141850379 [Brevipalpus obovatus]|uniref:uncharacterized protein LOC141850379 n=1 Tax=Brevipalpus obovatus TaxID=246614 RepID=UPI003D9ED072
MKRLICITFSIVLLVVNCVHGIPQEFGNNQDEDKTTSVKPNYELKLKAGVNDTCREMEQEADASFKKILMIGENLKIPRNQSELIDHCKLAKPALKLANNYGKCLTPFPRQVLRILIRGAKKSLKEYCDTSRGREQILKYLTCLTEENAQIFYAALERGIGRIDYVANEVKNDDLVSTLCCTFHLLYGNVMKVVQAQCGNSSADTIKFIRPIVDSIAGDVLEVGCVKYPSMESCDAQLPKIMNQLRNVEFKNKTNLAKKFLIAPVITIAQRLVE